MLWYIGGAAGTIAFIAVAFLVIFCVYETRFRKEFPYIQVWLKDYGYKLVKAKTQSELNHWAIMPIGFKEQTKASHWSLYDDETNIPKTGYTEGRMYYEIYRVRKIQEPTNMCDALKQLQTESTREVKRSKIWEK